MGTNNWLKDYGKRLEQLNYTLEQSIQRGSFDTELNLKEVMSLFRGSVNEIKSLQSQVDVLKEALKKAKENIEK